MATDPNACTFLPYGECRSDLQCSICLDPWNQPVELKPCGHIFCSGCIATIRNCPECRQLIKQRCLPNQIIQRLAMNVTLRCEQCGWIGSRLDSQSHRCLRSVAQAPQFEKCPANQKKTTRGFLSRLLFGSRDVERDAAIASEVPSPPMNGSPPASPPPPLPPSLAPVPSVPQPLGYASSTPDVEAVEPSPIVTPPAATTTAATAAVGAPASDERWMHRLAAQFPNLDLDVVLDICRSAESQVSAYDLLSVIHADAPDRAAGNNGSYAPAPAAQFQVNAHQASAPHANAPGNSRLQSPTEHLTSGAMGPGLHPAPSTNQASSSLSIMKLHDSTHTDAAADPFSRRIGTAAGDDDAALLQALLQKFSDDFDEPLFDPRSSSGATGTNTVAHPPAPAARAAIGSAGGDSHFDGILAKFAAEPTEPQ